MKKHNRMNFLSVLLLGMNGIIGSGIFLLPGQIAAKTGIWSLLVYLVATAIIICIGLCFSDCATRFDKNGGAYLYAKAAFGDFIGFQVGWIRWTVGTVGWATLISALLSALEIPFPALKSDVYRVLAITGWIGSLTWINIQGNGEFNKWNNWITWMKLSPLLLFISWGIWAIHPPNYCPEIWITPSITDFGKGVLIAFYAFSGFEALVVIAGEIESPKKNMPIAVVLTIALCSLLYFIIQFLTIGLLGPTLTTSISPLSDASLLFLGTYGQSFVFVGMILSILGINLVTSFIVPRSGVVLAEDGMIPRWFAKKGRNHTPYRMILTTASCAALIVFFFQFSQLIILSVVSRSIQYIATCSSVIVFRSQEEKKNGHRSNPQKYLIPTLALLGIFWVLSHAEWEHLWIAGAALTTGCPLYLIMRPSQTSIQ